MSYKQDLINNIFDLQSHYKMTAAFLVNKLFLLKQVWFKYTQNIDILSWETFAHICLLYFEVIPISQNWQKPPVPEPRFI